MKKSRWLNLCVSAALAVLGGLVAVSAQQPSSAVQQPAQQENKAQRKPGEKGKAAGDKPEEAEPGQIRQITINVRLPITVTDGKTNRFITDLKQSDFEVHEDKTKQEIISFQPLSDLPLDVAILMDTSNSVKPKLKFEKDASVSFLYTMLQSRKDRALFATC
jgi:Ca-activated chloride channel homolog